MSDRQLRLGVGHGAPRALFSERILDELDVSPDAAPAGEVARVLTEMRAVLEREGPTLAGANEAQTEERADALIYECFRLTEAQRALIDIEYPS